jgi:hypothetical protein
MMIKDHTAADTKGTNLAKQAKLTPSDSPVSTMLKADSDKTVDQLKTQTGADLERAYIDAQVKAHQTVLDAIDTKLMPNVKDPGIKAMLTEMRPKIEMHLKEAQEIQKALGGGTGTTGATGATGGTTGATGGTTGTTGTTGGATGGTTGTTGGATGGTTGKTGTTK